MNFPENLVEGKEYSIAFDIMLINEEKTFGFKKMDLKLIDDNYTSINYKNKVNIVQNPDTTFVFKGVNDLVSVNYKFRYNRKLKSFIIGYMMDKGINDTLFFQDLDRIMKMSKKRYSRTSNFNYVLMRNHSEKIEIDLDYSFDYGISNLKIFEQ
jgi:hypothetical protein